MAGRKKVDWDALESHYRAGIRSLKDIGAEFGVSDAAIVKHAKQHEWSRNLKAKVQAKADAKVSAAMVSAEVSARTKATEAVRVEVEAEVQARIRLGHRKDISRARDLVMSLLGEVESQTLRADLYEKLGDLMYKPDDKGIDKLAEAYRKAMSTPSRVGSIKSLSEALKTLIGLEREAYGISDGDGEKNPANALNEILKMVQSQGSRLPLAK